MQRATGSGGKQPCLRVRVRVRVCVCLCMRGRMVLDGANYSEARQLLGMLPLVPIIFDGLADLCSATAALTDQMASLGNVGNGEVVG